MDNVVLTSASQISPSAGHPLNPDGLPPLASEPVSNATLEALVATPLEPLGENHIDGNFQAHMDVNYQAHDVALASAPAKANGHEQTNGLTLGEHHKMEIDDGYDHPDKAKSCCSMLNKLFLALAIVCFALFLCSIAFIVANLEELNGKHDARGPSRISHAYPLADPFSSTERMVDDPYFNLTHPNQNGIIVVLARRGAAIRDILIPDTANGMQRYRSIVLQGDNRTNFGAVRFGFEDEGNLLSMTNQLPMNYPFLNFYDQNWSMYADTNKPHRVRFVHDLVEVIYEFSLSNINELIMTSIVSAPVYQSVIADPTNNIYFNLRGFGNLSTHNLNVSSAVRINSRTGEQVGQNRSSQAGSVDQFTSLNNYFYKFDSAGIGRNYIATLSESETKMNVHLFADHSGLVIDPFGMAMSKEMMSLSEMRGIRLSPRQSPVYQAREKSIYGPTLVMRPSQGIHTTWWQFEY